MVVRPSMEGETIMSEADPPRQATSGDNPESWGFHLLQELRRMEDKMDAKIDAVESRTHAQINDLAQEVSAPRYWSWSAILTVIAGAIATILTVLFH